MPSSDSFLSCINVCLYNCMYHTIIQYDSDIDSVYFVCLLSHVLHLVGFRPASRANTPSYRMTNLPCTDISNSTSLELKPGRSDVTLPSVDHVKVQKTGRQFARRSLRYDSNENIIDDKKTDYVVSRKRRLSPVSPASEKPRKRSCTEQESATLESLDVQPLQEQNDELEHRVPQKLATMIIGRRSGQWKLSTPTRERGATPSKDDGTTPLDTPSKNVTFHDSVIGGDSDSDIDRSVKVTPRRADKVSSTSKRESLARLSESETKLPPRARRTLSLTPASDHKRTPRKTASSPGDVTPQRSSARIASSSNKLGSSVRSGKKSTPRTEEKTKDLPARRLVVSSSPGTGRVLRPRTPKSYRFTAVERYDDDDDDQYHPDNDEEEFAVKKTPTRKSAKEVVRTLNIYYCKHKLS